MGYTRPNRLISLKGSYFTWRNDAERQNESKGDETDD